MLKDIAAGTCVQLLSRIDDKALGEFWREISTGKYPIVDFQGNLGYSLLNEDGISYIRNDFPTTSYDPFELVFGGLFLPDTVQELLSKDKVLLLMVYRKGTPNLLLSELRTDFRFMLDLPLGQYFFFAFLLDAGAETLLNSTLYAVGFPSRLDLNSPEFESFYLSHPVDIWEFVDTAPVEIRHGGPFYINMIMINIEKIPDCSTLFSELLQEDESTSPL